MNLGQDRWPSVLYIGHMESFEGLNRKDWSPQEVESSGSRLASDMNCSSSLCHRYAVLSQ